MAYSSKPLGRLGAALRAAAVVVAVSVPAAPVLADTSAPSASVQTIYSFGGKPPRADLMMDGRVVSVRVGALVQGWEVTAINANGVVVQQTRLQRDPLAQGPRGAAPARAGAAQTARESASWFAPARSVQPGPQMVEFRVTHLLPSAIQAPASGSTRGPSSAISIQ